MAPKRSQNSESAVMQRPAGLRPLPRGFLIAAGLLLFLAGCSTESDATSEQGNRPERGIEIVPHAVSYLADVVEIESVGTARAIKTAVIRPEHDGEVTAINFAGGDTVAKGDVLLQMESSQEELAVRQARVALKDAEQLVARFEGIELPGAISDSRIDEAKIAVERARIELELAQVALEERSVKAPFDGVVGLTDIDAGTRITTDTEITQLDDRSTLFVDFQVPEEVYGRINLNEQIVMQPFANQQRNYTANVHKIDSRIAVDSRSFTVRAAIDNSDDSLRPGMSFKIDISLAGNRFPTVPEAAIIWGGDGPYVWLVDDGVVKRQSVTIVGRQAGKVLVRAPIAEQSFVIAEGVQKVREGSKVEVSELYTGPSLDLEPGAPVPALLTGDEAQNHALQAAAASSAP